MPETPSPVLCVCGAALESVECLQRAHLRGPQPFAEVLTGIVAPSGTAKDRVESEWTNWVEGSDCPSCGTRLNDWSAGAMVCATCRYEPPLPDRHTDASRPNASALVLSAIADDISARKGTPDAWSVSEVIELLRALASGDPDELDGTRWDDLFDDDTGESADE